MVSERRAEFLKLSTVASIAALSSWLDELEAACVEQLVKADGDDFRKIQGKVAALRDIRRGLSPAAAGGERLETLY